jgi:hypothetical protein
MPELTLRYGRALAAHFDDKIIGVPAGHDDESGPDEP